MSTLQMKNNNKNKLSSRINRAKDIYAKEGLVTLFRRTFTFLLSWFSYEKCTFYVSELLLEHENEVDFIPKIQNFTFKIVETKRQLDELSTNGFDLSLLDITQAQQRLEKGAILSLIFVDHVLAWKGWSAMTEEAKNTFNRYPYKVDFSNNEACNGDAWTNPKYRRQGIYTYGSYKRREYLMAKGVRKTRSIMLTNNIAIQRTIEHTGGRRIYAKARYIRIGRLQFWKETPVESIKNND